jgi:hypothetical protein
VLALVRLNAGVSGTCHRVTLAKPIHYHCAVLWAGRKKKKREGEKEGGESEEENEEK